VHEEFCYIFHNFRKLKNEIDLLTSPFFFDVKEAPGNLQLELTDLQSGMELKQKFISMKFAEMLDVSESSTVI
jgi:hypothetical protein